MHQSIGTFLKILALAVVVALSVLIAGSRVAFAYDVFAKIPHPNQSGVVLTGDIATMLKEGHIKPSEHALMKELATALMDQTRETFQDAKKAGLIIAGKPAAYYLKQLNSIDLFFDAVPMMEGFGVLAGKTSSFSATAYYNQNTGDRKVIMLPIWRSKMLPIVSEILPGANRGLVQIGTFFHEVISVFGGKDADYLASTNLIWQLYTKKQKDSSAAFQVQASKPLILAGGGSLVGGAGSDLAFATKWLMEALQGVLLGNDPAPTFAEDFGQHWEKLQNEVRTLTAAQRELLQTRLSLTVVEELGCGREQQDLYAIQKETSRDGTTLRYLVNICRPRQVEELLKKDPKILDKVAIAATLMMVLDFKRSL